MQKRKFSSLLQGVEKPQYKRRVTGSEKGEWRHLENPITEQRKIEEAAPRGTKKNRGKNIEDEEDT
jgi:hypothetical protein